MRERWILAAALVAAAALRLWSIDFGFPGRYRPDEGYIVLKAFRVLQGQLDPGFYVYPSLYIYATALVLGAVQTLGELFGLFGGKSFAAFAAAREAVPVYLTGRLTTAALGVAGVFAAYLLGRDAFGRGAGLLGAMLLALNFSHARESHFATTDVPAALLATLVLWRLLSLARRARLRDYLLAGALAGLAVSTKYTAALLAVPCLAAHLLALRERPVEQSRTLQLRRPLAGLAAAFAAFACTSPYVLLNSGRFREDVSTFITGELLRGEGLPVGGAERRPSLDLRLRAPLRRRVSPRGPGGRRRRVRALPGGWAQAGRGRGAAAADVRRGGARRVLPDGGAVLPLHGAADAGALPAGRQRGTRSLPGGVRHTLEPRRGRGGRAAGRGRAGLAHRLLQPHRRPGRHQTARPGMDRGQRPGRGCSRRQGPPEVRPPAIAGAGGVRQFHPLPGREGAESAAFPLQPGSSSTAIPFPPIRRSRPRRSAVSSKRKAPWSGSSARSSRAESQEAVFDAADAFYIPVGGFGAVVRPGPGLTIYRVAGR